jgi:hypothetical protein
MRLASRKAMRNQYKILVRNPKENRSLERLGKIILKQILRKQGGSVWTGLGIEFLA